ncbi:MAG: hypothetical protein JXA69_16420 [Phycisphaerae bacterium]|nr:hypothetical protein [Phycisphaerae bacterium]
MIEPAPEDRARIEDNIEEITVEFTIDGRMITRTTDPDGRTVVDCRSRYSVDDEVITISNPEYDLKASRWLGRRGLRYTLQRAGPARLRPIVCSMSTVTVRCSDDRNP